MKDDRVTLKEKLIAVGIPKSKATIIALDAGSSQIIVDAEYLRQNNLPSELLNSVFEKVSELYFGHFSNES